MITYKLIKEYPGSPELGRIMRGERSNIITTYINSDDDSWFDAHTKLRDYPEYWEKVEYKPRKFKLIKTYPNFTVLGTVIEESLTNESPSVNRSYYKMKNFGSFMIQPEDYPEYWEEIK